jgi:hypothetical protein
MNKSNKELQAEYSNDNFFRTFAIAMLQWQSVEHNLYILFHSLIRSPQVGSSGAVFYALDSFGTKLRLVDKTFIVTIKNDNRLKQWAKLKKQLLEAYEDRNVLAHLTVLGDFREDGAIQLVMGPSLYVPSQLIRKRKKKYDLAELGRIVDKFEKLGQDIATFSSEVITSAR